jgi:ADP-ribose pyrophosphatase YjhB (NUDIX family)
MTDDNASSGTARVSFALRVPHGDTLTREVCETCGFINYINPKIVAGAIVHHDDKILMCKRAIEPRRGFWTLPAGFMEQHETAEAAARREAREEACADIVLEGLLAVYSIPRISQVQLIYRARFAAPSFAAGPESLEVALLGLEEVPWDNLAFPSVHWALRHFEAVRGLTSFPPFTNPPGETGDRIPRPPNSGGAA